MGEFFKRISEAKGLQVGQPTGEQQVLRLTFGLWLLLETAFQGLSAFGMAQFFLLSPSITLYDVGVTCLSSWYFCWVLTAVQAVREKHDL